MKSIEAFLIQTLGEDWLNSGVKKDAAFSILRMATDRTPPDAVVFATVINKFGPSERLRALPPDERERISRGAGSADKAHKLVREGLFTVHDALMCCAQTPQRVCMYVRAIHRGSFADADLDVKFLDQEQFDGRVKMFGKHYELPIDPTKRSRRTDAS